MGKRHRITNTLLACALAILPGTALPGPAELAKEAGCTMCHAVDMQMLGPSYKAVAARYAGNDKAAETLFAALRAGAEGNWGGAPMMAVDAETIGDDDLRTVIAWILAQK